MQLMMHHPAIFALATHPASKHAQPLSRSSRTLVYVQSMFADMTEG